MSEKGLCFWENHFFEKNRFSQTLSKKTFGLSWHNFCDAKIMTRNLKTLFEIVLDNPSCKTAAK